MFTIVDKNPGIGTNKLSFIKTNKPSNSLIDYNIFGKPTGNMGMCQYFTSSLYQVVSNTNIVPWELQRSLDQNRVNEIGNYFLEEYRKYGHVRLRGTIILCKKIELMGPNNTYYLIDGQHRYYSLAKLVQEKLIPDIHVRFDILLVRSEEEIREEFNNINKSVPVPVHYLTPCDIINLCCERLKREYPYAFKQGKCNRPSIDIDKFKDTLMNDDYKIIENFGIGCSDELYEVLIKLNTYYNSLGLEAMQDLIGRKNKRERDFVKNNYHKCVRGEFLCFGLFKTTDWATDINKYQIFLTN
jgi:hypothetical protein